MAVDDRTTARRDLAESREYMDEQWRRLQVFAKSSGPIPQGRSVAWLLRNLITIGLVHAAVLVTVYFLLLLGDALFTSYAIVMRDAVFVSYVAQLGWLQRMASDVKAAIAFVVGLSALVQMLLFLWRVFVD